MLSHRSALRLGLVAALVCGSLGFVAGGTAPKGVAPKKAVTPLPLYTTPDSFGADPTGKTDSTAALQACIDATPDMGCILFSPQAVYTTSGPLSVFGRDGLTFRSLGGTDTAGPGKGGAVINYVGTAAGVNAAVDVNQSRRITFDHIGIYLGSAPTPPAAAISFDMYPVAGKTSPVNCTRCAVRGCVITMPPGVAACDGIADSKVSRLNCEYMFFDDVTIQPPGSQAGSGIGVHVYASANAKGIRCRDVSVSYAAVGFLWEWGSGHLDGCTGTGNGVYIKALNFSDPFTVRNCDAEQCGQVLNFAGQDSPLTVESNRFVVTGPSCFDLHNRQTILRGNRVYCPTPAAGAAPPIAFVPYSNPAFAIERQGNLWSYVTPNDGFFGSRTVGAVEWERSY